MQITRNCVEFVECLQRVGQHNNRKIEVASLVTGRLYWTTNKVGIVLHVDETAVVTVLWNELNVHHKKVNRNIT